MANEEKKHYKIRYDRLIKESKDMTKNETFRASALSEAKRIKRAYL